ncbi:MAG: tRNA pseudouridine13 synthase, partial [Planctomycetota bacterium]
SQLRSVKHLVPDLPREFCALAKQISRRAGNWESALRAMDRKTLRFHLTSFQSRLFNRVLAARIESFDRPGLGDLAQVHPARSFFEVTAEEDLAEVERRARDGEISPTGPMFGSRAPLAIGTPGEIELEALKAEGISPEIFSKRVPSVELAGERRSLRARISDLLFRWEDGVLQLNFSLPPGSYATTLIAELSKTP